MNEIIDEALEAASLLPSPPAFRAWWLAHQAGRVEEETVKRAFRAVFSKLANGRFDDFMRILGHAETRVAALKRDQLASWAQAAAVRALLELMWSERVQCAEDARERQTRAAAIAAAALRFARAAAERC
jgi:hypothetical protein